MGTEKEQIVLELVVVYDIEEIDRVDWIDRVNEVGRINKVDKVDKVDDGVDICIEIVLTNLDTITIE